MRPFTITFAVATLLSAITLSCSGCNSRELAEKVPLAQTGWLISTVVIGRTSALGGGRMEIGAHRKDQKDYVLLARIDDEENSHVHVEGDQIVIEVPAFSFGYAHLIVHQFQGFEIKLRPNRSL